VFEIRNAFPLLGDLVRLVGVLLAEPFILSAQTLDLARMTIQRVPSLTLVPPASISHAEHLWQTHEKSTSTEFWIGRTAAADPLNCYFLCDVSRSHRVDR